ncbi:hypothetical protein DL96DRAFT_998884 [Flagelloscypha sp. PMI_526]|nr:hypothetical protein DL96DRAFT_998884 [Flagelloscypha sp. PMI_526]
MAHLGSRCVSLEAEIASLETRLLLLRIELNSLRPVNQLPEDLLITVFKLVRGQVQNNFGWVRGITDVSSLWRKVALNRREFWSTIFLPGAEDVLATLLQRANGYPLSLHSEDTFSLLYKFFPAIPYALKSLHIELSDAESLLRYLTKVLNHGVPSLRTIHVTESGDTLHEYHPLTNFLLTQCPALEDICIPGLFIGPNSLQGLDLTSLSLVEFRLPVNTYSYTVQLGSTASNDPPAKPKPYDILASLSHCQRLRQLSLQGYYLQYYDKSPSSSSISLPSLVELELRDTSVTSAINVIQAFDIRDIFAIRCYGISNVDGDQSPKEACSSLQDLVRSMLRHCRPFLSTTLILEYIKLPKATISLRVIDNSYGSVHVPLQLDILTTSQMQSHLVDCLISPLDPTSFDEVVFIGDTLNAANHPFFQNCPARKVTAMPWDHLHGLAFSTPPAVEPVPFPKLEVLEVRGTDGYFGFGILEPFWWRMRRGLKPPRVELFEVDERGANLSGNAVYLLRYVTDGIFKLGSDGGLEEYNPHEAWNNWFREDDWQLQSAIDSEEEALSANDEDWDQSSDDESANSVGDRWGSWLLRSEEPLLEDEESGDDYSQ